MLKFRLNFLSIFWSIWWMMGGGIHMRLSICWMWSPLRITMKSIRVVPLLSQLKVMRLNISPVGSFTSFYVLRTLYSISDIRDILGTSNNGMKNIILREILDPFSAVCDSCTCSQLHLQEVFIQKMLDNDRRRNCDLRNQPKCEYIIKLETWIGCFFFFWNVQFLPYLWSYY